jgi:DNA-directed RNA polymerase subunit RPC12/RpoP
VTKFIEIVKALDFSDSLFFPREINQYTVGPVKKVDPYLLHGVISQILVPENSNLFSRRVNNALSKGETVQIDEVSMNPLLLDLIKEDMLTIGNELKRENEVSLAKNCETAGRFDDAAGIYDGWNMFEEAGNARAKARTTNVKVMNIQVDVSALLRQVRDEGIVAIYKCPRCGGNLKIGKTTTSENLRICDHCGSEIDTMELADFLKTLLS